MDGLEHLLRRRLQRGVDQAGRQLRLGLGILAADADGLAARGIAQIGQIGVVQLHVAAAGIKQVGDFLAIDLGKIVVERLQLGIGVPRHGFAAAAQAHGRRGNGDLGGAPLARRRRQDLEIPAHDRRGAAQPAGYAEPRWAEFQNLAVRLVEVRRRRIDNGLSALDRGQEIQVEIGAAEFPVGDDLQADVLLQGHRVADGDVLDAPELQGRQDASLGLGAGPGEGGRAQQTADVIGAERRPGLAGGRPGDFGMALEGGGHENSWRDGA